MAGHLSKQGTYINVRVSQQAREVLCELAGGAPRYGYVIDTLILQEAARRSTLVEVESLYRSPFLAAGEFEVSHG